MLIVGVCCLQVVSTLNRLFTMRTQQVLALCVFACIACGALAYDGT